jgi:hypothetical protein
MMTGAGRRSRQRLAAGQSELDLSLTAGASSDRPLEIASSRMGTCAMPCAVRMTCSVSGRPLGGYEVFRQLVLARIIEPVRPAHERQLEDDQAYYRCRLSSGYALANRVDHPQDRLPCARPTSSAGSTPGSARPSRPTCTLR